MSSYRNMFLATDLGGGEADTEEVAVLAYVAVDTFLVRPLGSDAEFEVDRSRLFLASDGQRHTYSYDGHTWTA